MGLDDAATPALPARDVPANAPAHGASDPLDRALDALDRLMRLFAMERLLYNVGAVASLLLFLYAGYRLFSQTEFTSDDMKLVLGASGVSTACSARVAHFLNRAFNVIEHIIRGLGPDDKGGE